MSAGLQIPGADGSYAVLLGSDPAVTGDIDIRLRVTPDDWNNGAVQQICGRWLASSNQRSVRPVITAAGALQLEWTTSGAAGTLVQEVASPALDTLFRNGEEISLRITLDVNNGAAGHTTIFSWSLDADLNHARWTVFDTNVTAGTTSIFAGTTNWTVGQGLGAGEAFGGVMHRLQVRDGIDGTVVIDVDFDAQRPGVNQFIDDTDWSWKMIGSARLGTTLDEAVQRPEVTWEARVGIDWDGDGYGAKGTLDTPISTRASVEHGFFDGMPDDVADSHAGVPAASSDLRGMYVRAPGRGMINPTGDTRYTSAVSSPLYTGQTLIVTALILPERVASGADQYILGGSSHNPYSLRLTSTGALALTWKTAASTQTITSPVLPDGLDGLLFAVQVEVTAFTASVVADSYTWRLSSVGMDGPWLNIDSFSGALITEALQTGGTSFAIGSNSTDGMVGETRAVRVQLDGVTVLDTDLTDAPDGALSFTDELGRAWSGSLGAGELSGLAVREFTAAQLYSPLASRSPLYGLTRDLAPARVGIDVVTEDGVQTEWIYNGLVLDTPVIGRDTANLASTSAARMLLAAPVQPPPYVYRGAGEMTTTWPVSYALHACGVRPSPAPLLGAAGTVWLPLHGGNMPYLDDVVTAMTPGETSSAPWAYASMQTGSMEWIVGPYSGALNGRIGDSAGRPDQIWKIDTGWSNYSPAGTAAFWDDMFQFAHLRFWMRGDACNLSASASANGIFNYEATVVTSGGATVARLRAWLDANRQLRASYFDGTFTKLGVLSTALPTDGLWHRVEVDWAAPSGITLTMSIDNTSATATGSPLTLAWGTGYNLTESATGGLPVAEWNLSRGAETVDPGPDWTSPAYATVYPSSVFINGPLEPDAVEGMEYLSRWARSEAAQMRIDEDDRFIYAPPGWFAIDGRGEVSETISTELDADTPTVRVDPTKIRNTVLVRYQARSGRTVESSLESSDTLEIPNGTSTFRVPLTELGAIYRGSSFHLVTSAELAAGVVSLSFPQYVTLNAAADGSSGVIADGVTAYVTAVYGAGAVEITFINPYGTVYTANNVGMPTLRLGGAILTRDTLLSESDLTSIAIRGERVISLTAEGGVTYEGASRTGRRVVHFTKDQMVELDPISTMGNPARTPGQLVRVVDSDQTGVDGTFRIRAIGHTMGPGQYEQDVHAVSSVPVGRWSDGVSRWGRRRWTARPFGRLAVGADA